MSSIPYIKLLGSLEGPTQSSAANSEASPEGKSRAQDLSSYVLDEIEFGHFDKVSLG
jgi:hypothetical protein